MKKLIMLCFYWMSLITCRNAEPGLTSEASGLQENRTISAALDEWHEAAAVADSAKYFDLMTDDAVFVGTDSSEVWTKDEFLVFAAPYFAKGKAWSFKPASRNIYGNKSCNGLILFDEMLDTWMGPCRGSGALVSENGFWKIKHYVLSVTVPNEKMKKFQNAMMEETD